MFVYSNDDEIVGTIMASDQIQSKNVISVDPIVFFDFNEHATKPLLI